MLGLFMMEFKVSPQAVAAMEERNKKWVEDRLAKAVPYVDGMTWEKNLNLKADTWESYRLFDTPAVDFANFMPDAVNKIVNETSSFESSPSGEFVYLNSICPRGVYLDTVYSNRTGNVIFDGPVTCAGLYQKTCNDTFRRPWMSITPSEVFSLRGGTKLAKGHTVIAGLGLGFQLIKAAERKQVEKITLVERSQELVDWLVPVVKAKMRPGVELDVIVGNAYQVVPKLTADVALIDIYPRYGGNEFYRCPSIPKVWIWGKQCVRRS